MSTTASFCPEKESINSAFYPKHFFLAKPILSNQSFQNHQISKLQGFWQLSEFKFQIYEFLWSDKDLRASCNLHTQRGTSKGLHHTLIHGTYGNPALIFVKIADAFILPFSLKVSKDVERNVPERKNVQTFNIETNAILCPLSCEKESCKWKENISASIKWFCFDTVCAISYIDKCHSVFKKWRMWGTVRAFLWTDGPSWATRTIHGPITGPYMVLAHNINLCRCRISTIDSHQVLFVVPMCVIQVVEQVLLSLT